MKSKPYCKQWTLKIIHQYPFITPNKCFTLIVDVNRRNCTGGEECMGAFFLLKIFFYKAKTALNIKQIKLH